MRSVAGLSVLALDDSNRRRTLALYLLARVAQCAYNSAKSKNKFHFWGSRWRHGDSLLFSISCAQVMYAFIMHPEELAKSISGLHSEDWTSCSSCLQVYKRVL
ncbi:hypothetical protein NC652_030054 [Populus alba x Populus x berolinensis]|nr:hypothetical protein NC652_030054 [Populus alba x Populus x berolinensis]